MQGREITAKECAIEDGGGLALQVDIQHLEMRGGATETVKGNWEDIRLDKQVFQSVYVRDEQGKRVFEVTDVLIVYEIDL